MPKSPIHAVEDIDESIIPPSPSAIRSPPPISPSISRTWRSLRLTRKGPPRCTCAKPPKGTFFTVRPETSKPWQNRGFYFLLELKDRDPYIVAPEIAKLKKEEDVHSPRADRSLRHNGRRGRPVGAQARSAGPQGRTPGTGRR